MAWWAISFLAILGTIICKFYFTTAANRLRQTLVRRQREALELKGMLGDTRQEHQLALRSCREKEAAIKRLQTHMAELEGKVEAARERAKDASSDGPGRRRL